MPMFEPILGLQSISYSNGEEWVERKKWVFKSLKGAFLEGYIPIFIDVSALSK